MKHLTIIFTLVIGAAEAHGQDFYQDFRGKEVDEQLFRFQGIDAILHVKPEPQGLRITLPPDLKAPRTVGVNTRFAIKGEFEISIGYEILQAERPLSGHGEGLEIYLNTDTPTEEALVFYRIARPKEGEVYICDRKTTNAGKRETTRKIIPADGKSGHLRISRKGTEVTFWAAEGAGENYKELCRYDWGPMDVRAVAMRAWSLQKLVDLRIIDLRIREQNPPAPVPAQVAVVNAPVAAVEAPAPAKGRLWLVAGLLGGFLLVAMIGAGLLLVLWGRTRKEAEVHANRSHNVSFFCSSCGKHLKASAASAGKTVKCPGCARLVPVPDTVSGIRAAGLN